MELQLELLLGAEIEFLDIYSRRGDSFHEQIDALFARLRAFPRLGPIYFPPFRKLLLKDTPYGIFYTVEGRRILITAILDLRADPDRIRARLSKP